MKIWLLIRDLLAWLVSKEYQLKLESYYYCSKKQSYFLIFRVRGKTSIRVVDIEDVCYDKDLLSMIHPIDAYMTGIIYSIQKNKIITEFNLMDYFRDYDSYIVVEPFLNIEDHHMNNDLISLKNKKSNESLKVPILDFYRKPFLLHGVGSVASNQLGFFTSEKFIMEIN